MKNKILYPLICIPSVIFGIICHYHPDLALVGLLVLSFLHMLLGCFFYKNKNISGIIWLIFLEGLALRLFYIAGTFYTDRQHDIGEFSNSGIGHFQYIHYLLQNHNLPFIHHTPEYPVCHPPLHYILSALLLTIFPGYENLQYMTLAWSFGSVLITYLCLRLIVKRESHLVLSALFCSFFPAFIIYSGSLNNDILYNFLGIVSVYCFLLHLKKEKICFLLLSSFFLGLAALAKISVTPMIYVGILVFYLIRIISHQIELKDALKSFALFSVICIPMIFIWPVYNYIHWHGYSVLSAHIWNYMGPWSETLGFWFAGYNPFLHFENITYNGYQYVGAYSLLERLGVIFEPLTEPYALSGLYYHLMIPEYNIWVGIIKSTLFDEYRLFYYAASVISTIGFDLSVILMGLSYILFFFFIAALCKVSSKNPAVLYCKSVVIAVMIGFIYWCLKNPVWSAVSFRYIAVLFPCLCYIAATYIQENLPNGEKRHKIYKNILGITIFLFSSISLIIYVLYGCL